MGKHNGKSRKTGMSVGSALVNRARKEGRAGGPNSYLYTTEIHKDNGPGIQSVIQQNDLEDLMSMVGFGSRKGLQSRVSVFGRIGGFLLLLYSIFLWLFRRNWQTGILQRIRGRL